MYKDMKNLIGFVAQEHAKSCSAWKNSRYYQELNMKKLLVHQIGEDKNLLKNILAYKIFLENNLEYLRCKIKSTSCKCMSRVKTQNSIENKIIHYINFHEHGKVPINKCLNDIFGIRIITTKPFLFRDIKGLISREFPSLVFDKPCKLKCINANKLNENCQYKYRATHIYFKTGSNTDFQWELQIWYSGDKEENFKSHKIHKQGYLDWENKNAKDIREV